jgi:NitT/TauT family transport system substrate-binding protein
MKRTFVFACLLLASAVVQAQQLKEFTIAKQPGIGYLNLVIMEEKKLIEKHAAALGLGEIKVNWAGFNSGTAINEALNTGKLHIASGGVAPLIIGWSNSQGNIKGLAALNTMPLFLNTKNPNVKSVAEFTEKDRIAMPAARTSIQAITLQMAVAQAFGEANFSKLDAITVGMPHPEANKKLLDPASEITAHFGAPPFQFAQLKDSKIKTVTSSYDVLVGVSSFNVVWTRAEIVRDNPKLIDAFMKALEEATRFARTDREAAAAIYVKLTGDKTPIPELVNFLSNPFIEYTMTPKNIWRYSNFMAKTGTIKLRPTSWKDLFFPNIHAQLGS